MSLIHKYALSLTPGQQMALAAAGAGLGAGALGYASTSNDDDGETWFGRRRSKLQNALLASLAGAAVGAGGVRAMQVAPSLTEDLPQPVNTAKELGFGIAAPVATGVGATIGQRQGAALVDRAYRGTNNIQDLDRYQQWRSIFDKADAKGNVHNATPAVVQRLQDAVNAGTEFLPNNGAGLVGNNLYSAVSKLGDQNQSLVSRWQSRRRLGRGLGGIAGGGLGAGLAYLGDWLLDR